MVIDLIVFVPFLGDFLSMVGLKRVTCSLQRFRPLSWGLSFNRICPHIRAGMRSVFVPFLGDFLSINHLLWGMSSVVLFSSPFLGTFFQSGIGKSNGGRARCFRPLSWGLSFNSVPAKPQPVCSRKRIRGGDEGIASSGTLLRR